MIRHLPNMISGLRLALLPVLLVVAYTQRPTLFLFGAALCFFTDVLDGLMARSLGLTSELGAKLDSISDFAFYVTIAIGAWWLWPDLLRRELPYFVTVLASICVPVLVALVKYRTTTSYHTWSVKLAALATGLSVLAMFGLGVAWPFRFAALCCAVAAAEEIAITVLLPVSQSNLPTFWHALRVRRRRG
ncbi:MAG: CDP-alcohol phosphatidyltransferase family protein [Gammaproteobacteria bacterium]